MNCVIYSFSLCLIMRYLLQSCYWLGVVPAICKKKFNCSIYGQVAALNSHCIKEFTPASELRFYKHRLREANLKLMGSYQAVEWPVLCSDDHVNYGRYRDLTTIIYLGLAPCCRWLITVKHLSWANCSIQSEMFVGFNMSYIATCTYYKIRLLQRNESRL
jgi:hypothetical protein